MGAVVVVVARSGVLDGLGLLFGQHADQAELVAERVLHDRPVDLRDLARERARTGVDRRRLLEPPGDRQFVVLEQTPAVGRERRREVRSCLGVDLLLEPPRSAAILGEL